MQYAVPQLSFRCLPLPAAKYVFHVNRNFCVGHNYAAYAREMGRDPDREKPFFFMKPANAAVDAGAGAVTIPYPPMMANFHHEIELMVAIGKGGANIPVEQALEHVHGYAVGLDMTRRDIRLQAREQGRHPGRRESVVAGDVMARLAPITVHVTGA
jgi:fumarylpyruvate hydrolase